MYLSLIEDCETEADEIDDWEPDSETSDKLKVTTYWLKTYQHYYQYEIEL